MALSAIACLEGRVLVFLEEFRIFCRTMRVMTAVAVHFCCADADMRLAEPLISKIMARRTKGLHRLARYKPRLRGGMGLMTPQTVPRGRRVHIFTLHKSANPLMAAQAQTRALRHKQLGQPGFVRVMTLRAMSLGYRLVAAYAVFDAGLYWCMAFCADLALCAGKHAVYIACMRVVAFQAEAVIERHMIVAYCLLFHKRGMALGAQLCAARAKEVLIVRSMRVMARITFGLRYRIVHDGLLESLPGVSVAGITQAVQSRPKQRIRSVRVVALGAHALFKGIMYIFNLQGFLLGVAGIAHLRAFKYKEIAVFGRVGQMAREASSFAFKGRVGIRRRITLLLMAA